MKKGRLSRDILVLTVLSLITAITWISLDIHRIIFEQEEIYVPPEQMEPLNTEIDHEIIDIISQESFLRREEYLPPEKISEEGVTEETEGAE